MDCNEPVDDYCEAYQTENLKIPEKIPSTDHNLDQFFIIFEVETTSPLIDDQEEDEFVKVEDTNFLTFWAPCPRLEHENLTKDRISDMLSMAGVPLHKQEFMVDRISTRADEIANAARNKGLRVLPMRVWISVIACLCCGEMNSDQKQSIEEISEDHEK